MTSLVEPWFIGDTVFLRSEDGVGAVRLPSPPVLMRMGEGEAFSLNLFRHGSADGPKEGIRGGAVLSLTIDLGAFLPQFDGLQWKLPAQVPDIAKLPLLGPTTVRLEFGGQEITHASVPGGYRPVVPLATTLDETAATVLRTVLEEGAPSSKSPLWATAEGGIILSASPWVRIEIDQRRVRRELAITESVGPADAAKLLAGLIESGAVQLSMDDPERLAEAQLVGAAMACARVFAPATSGVVSSFIPGVVHDAYSPAGALRLRDDLGEAVVSIEAAAGPGAILPWFGAAPIVPRSPSAQLTDLGRTSVVAVKFMPVRSRDDDVHHVTVEVEGPPGVVQTMELPMEGGAAQEGTARIVASPGWDYRWRWSATRRDGTTFSGGWETSDRGFQMIELDVPPGPASAPDVT